MTYLHRMAEAPRHEPEYHTDERWDELYVSCFACGQEWPCDQSNNEINTERKPQ